VASPSQGRTAAAQCGLFTHKSVPVIFEPPCIYFTAMVDNLFPGRRIGCDRLTEVPPWSLNSLFFFNVSKSLVNQDLLDEVPRLHPDTPHSVRLLSPHHRSLPDRTQHSQETDIPAHSRIRTRNPSKRTDLDPRLISCGHWDRLSLKSTSTQFLFVGL